ncbi:hypothetical protein [Mucilaginibacter myungsuensis]|uniref:Uncharacterized protein n=1 Tax=Mucilaginibacter myungsuensis TaxID=649104 RepID=A0A929PUY9_9SPHI|nr:hypothetical protein [Mucilaginibacter myungsuensis]MBE9660589.1 hypothetical protein [Mucilaginibacter myungsuensis]MDN3600633.1 hypothetical protein [Mucilaginibacter myungsuensis]
MNSKFFYLYLVGGTLALVLLFCEVYMPHKAALNNLSSFGYMFAVVLLFFLAFKTYHKKEDSELM